MIHNIGKQLINNHLCLNRNFINNNSYSYFIFLKDHNNKINPEKTRLWLSYMSPKIISQEVPQSKKFMFVLRKKSERQLERKLFEEYKQKVLKGQIDEDQEVQVDPLWGEAEKPIHYYQTLSKRELMKTSHPQIKDIQAYLRNLYKSQFVSSFSQLPEIGQLIQLKPEQLVEVALLAKLQQKYDRNYWHQLEILFGNKFYQLSSDSLIKLYNSLNGAVKMGTPKINSITKDLLLQDMQTLSKKQLINLFYSCRHSKRQAVPFIKQVLKNLQKFYQTMTLEQKINWILTYTAARRPATLVKTQQKIRHEDKHKAHQILFKLQFPTNLSQSINDDLCIKLLYSLAKLRAKNTKFLTDQILVYIRNNLQQFCSNLENVGKALFYLEEVNGGVGVYDQVIFKKFIEVITKKQNFEQLDKYKKIKTIYALWNYKLMDDDIFQLYKNIQIEADSTMLYYFCQIELNRSSERQWQVLRCMAELNSLPLPYFVPFKRFYNYMKESTDWDLQPIEQKLRNTEFCYNACRNQDSFFSYTFYSNLMKFFQFSGVKSPFQHTYPIDNIQLAQFGCVAYQVSVDVVDQTAFIPGTDSLKSIFVNKIISLKQIGWKHIYIRQKQILKLPIQNQFMEIAEAFQPYIEQQTQQIARRGQIRAQQIENIRINDYWDNLVEEQAEGFRNNPQEYSKKVAELAERQKKLMEQIDKIS